MKRIAALLTAAAIVAGMLFLTSCAGSEFALISDSEKHTSVKATKAKVGSESMAGGLEVAEGEKIVMTSALESGAIDIELTRGPDEQSIDELPEPEGDPVMTFSASGTESISGGVPAGYYFIKAVVTEKATGTVDVEVVSE